MARLLSYCLIALGTSAVFVPASLEFQQSQQNQDSTGGGVDADTVRRLTPSAQHLRKRFGVANSGNDLTDEFVLAPDFKLSVKYGSDRLACSISIAPIDSAHPYLPREKVSELLDELAPPTMRGTGGQGEFRSSACGGVILAGYENVVIGRWPNYCVPEHPGTDKSATIEFKRNACPNPSMEKKVAAKSR